MSLIQTPAFWHRYTAGALLLFAAAGCADSSECGLGTRFDGGVCLPASVSAVCGAGTVTDPVTGACVPAPDAQGGTDGGPDASEPDVEPGPPDSAGGDTVIEFDIGCVPTCPADKGCGDDGCGGSCGTCADGEKCGPSNLCIVASACVPSCANGQLCGDNGCGGVCGLCTDFDAPVCIDGLCGIPCVPDCVDKTCGDDGCGGVCGTCDAGTSCGAESRCLPGAWTCAASSYEAGDQCDCGCGAPDPDCDLANLIVAGCGAFEKCLEGVCTSTVAAGWTCGMASYDDGTFCDCGCGAADPDCDEAGAVLFGCGAQEVCDNGSCVSAIPAEWTCAKEVFGYGGVCDCGCGAVDPDCTLEDAAVNGCAAGQRCGATGVCEDCFPSCAGKQCGSDGCGGVCGDCSEAPPTNGPLACVNFQCVADCLPEPLICATNECGDDHCGGTCGTCPKNTFCDDGQCAPAPGSSCAGHCKGLAPNGCSCTMGCELNGTCCPDYAAVCECDAACAGKMCGDDGCGGSCGVCDPASAKPYCDGEGQCGTTCVPQCAGKSCGPDGCGGTCGACASGAACNDSGSCVGPEWTCDLGLYADGYTCDCSCGLPDPDCIAIAEVYGCPSGVGCDITTGLCDMAFCSKTSECKVPKWCIGHYPTGDGHLRGACRVPDPSTAGAGMPCAFDTDCASRICAAGTCRNACTVDADCSDGGRCVGVPFVDALTLAPLGVASVCDSGALLGGACASQAACGSAHVCLAAIDATDLSAVYRCGVLADPLLEGAVCETADTCGIGLVCSGGQCMRPCPGGAADCPSGTTCGMAVLHGGTSTLTSDDVLVNACVQQ
jgi:hypothetical protein